MLTVAPMAYGFEGNGSPAETSQTPYQLLKAEIDAANAMCPLEAGLGMTLTQIKLDTEFVAYYYDVDESINSIDFLRENREQTKKTSLYNLLSPDPNLQAFVELCVNADIGVKYIYTGETSNKKCTITIEYYELKSN